MKLNLNPKNQFLNEVFNISEKRWKELEEPIAKITDNYGQYLSEKLDVKISAKEEAQKAISIIEEIVTKANSIEIEESEQLALAAIVCSEIELVKSTAAKFSQQKSMLDFLKSLVPKEPQEEVIPEGYTIPTVGEA